MADDIFVEDVGVNNSYGGYVTDEGIFYSDNFTMTDILQHFNFHSKEQIYLLIIIFILTTVGNSSLIIALCRSNKETRTKMEYFLVHLAVADILVALFSMSTDISFKISLQWKAGEYCCKFVRYTQHMAIFASSYLLVGLSIERLDSILRPIRFYTKDFVAKILVILAWVFSCIMAIPFVVLNDIRYSDNGTIPQCGIHFIEHWHWKVYITTLTMLVFFVPAFIIICCYIAIIIAIWHRSHVHVLKPSSSIKSTHANSVTRSAELLPQPVGQNNTRNALPLVQIRSVKISSIIVIGFIICLLPLYLHEILDMYVERNISQSNVTLAVFIHILSSVHYTLNPFVYAAYNCNFTSRLRQTILQMFRPSSNKGYKLQELPAVNTETSSPVSRSVCTTTLDAPSEVPQTTPPPKVTSCKIPRCSLASSISADVTPWRNSATESDILYSITDVGEKDIKT